MGTGWRSPAAFRVPRTAGSERTATAALATEVARLPGWCSDEPETKTPVRGGGAAGSKPASSSAATATSSATRCSSPIRRATSAGMPTRASVLSVGSPEASTTPLRLT